MYKDGYVLAILANGGAIEESNERTVPLPFGTEYKVRMINKNNDRCAADLIVNGEQVARFILNSGETTDIERFLDGNLNSGKRFKFTHLNDSKVKDKKDIDNGIVEVRFYREKHKQNPLVIEKHIHHWDHYPVYPVEPKPWKPYIGDPMWNYTNNAGTYDMCKGMSSGGSMAMNCCSSPTSSFTGLDGATVRGSESDQKFTEVSGYEFESVATTLKLKIVNGESQTVSRYCSGCGRKRRDGEKFCSNCGIKL